MSCPGNNYAVPSADPCSGGGGVAGVSSLNSMTGAIQISAADNSITVTNEGGIIELQATSLTDTVLTLNDIKGHLQLTGAGITTVNTITATGIEIETLLPALVTSVNGMVDNVTFQAGTGIELSDPVANVVTISNTAPTGVVSLNSLNGGLSLVGGTNVTVTPGATTITISATAGAGGVSSVAGVDGAVLLTSSDESITFETDPVHHTINLQSVNNGVLLVNEMSGSVGIIGGTGIGVTTVEGNSIEITNTAINVTALIPNGQILHGDITITPGTNVTFDVAGNDITINSSSEPMNGVQSLNNKTGVMTVVGANSIDVTTSPTGVITIDYVAPNTTFVATNSGTYAIGEVGDGKTYRVSALVIGGGGGGGGGLDVPMTGAGSVVGSGVAGGGGGAGNMVKTPDFYCKGGFLFAVAIGAGGAGGQGGNYTAGVNTVSGQEAGNTILSPDPTARITPYPSVEAEGGFGGVRGVVVPPPSVPPPGAISSTKGGQGGNSYYMSGGGGGSNNANLGMYLQGIAGLILTGGATPADLTESGTNGQLGNTTPVSGGIGGGNNPANPAGDLVCGLGGGGGGLLYGKGGSGGNGTSSGTNAGQNGADGAVIFIINNFA